MVLEASQDGIFLLLTCRAAGSNVAFSFSAARDITVGPALTHKRKLTVNAAAKAARGRLSMVRWTGRFFQSGRAWGKLWFPASVIWEIEK